MKSTSRRRTQKFTRSRTGKRRAQRFSSSRTGNAIGKILGFVLIAGGAVGIAVTAGLGLVVMIGAVVALVAALVVPFAWLFQLVWNGFIASAFNGPHLTFLQAYAGWLLLCLGANLIRLALGRKRRS